MLQLVSAWSHGLPATITLPLCLLTLGGHWGFLVWKKLSLLCWEKLAQKSS